MTATSETSVVTSALPAACDKVLARTIELCRVPAPPFGEEARSALVRDWWVADGLRLVQVDAIGNVWAQLRDGSGPAVVVCAHVDTVFAADVEHVTAYDGVTLVGPGVGDDGVAVAALSVLDSLLPERVPSPVWLLATVGEEGLGNLRGVTFALDHPLCAVGAMVALEGNYLGRVNTVGVGSVRWRVTVTGPGGHAWEERDAPSAVHAAATLVAGLDTMARPDGTSSVNIGTIHGGESVNSRASSCSFELDLRSDDPDCLAGLVEAAQVQLAALPEGLTVDQVEIGMRPAGSIDAGHPLVRAAQDALAGVGRTGRLTAASTDANAAYARGVPAITLGVTEGSGTHTEQEWITVEPIADGLHALAQTLLSIDLEEW